MKAVWYNQLDFTSLCRTSRLELAKAFGSMGHQLRIVGRYRRRSRPPLPPIRPRPLLLKQHLPDPLGGILFQLQVLLLAAGDILNKTDLILVDHYCALTMFPFNLLSKARLIPTRFVLDIRSCPVDMIGTRYAISRWRYNLSIRWCKLFYDGLTTVSQLYRSDISSRFNLNAQKIGVWTSAVSPEVFDPQRVDRTRLRELRCQFALGHKLVLMYHGVVSPYRGLQEVVKALSLLSAEGHRHAAFVLVGDGPGTAEIAALAEKEGVHDAIRIVKPVPHEEVPDYLGLCDVGIMPYPDIEWLNRNSPLKLLEYLAMEKPVILTDIAAHRAVVGNAECAFFIDSNSPAHIARAIRLISPPALSARLQRVGRLGRQLVLRNFSWEKQVDRILAYAKSLQ